MGLADAIDEFRSPDKGNVSPMIALLDHLKDEHPDDFAALWEALEAGKVSAPDLYRILSEHHPELAATINAMTLQRWRRGDIRRLHYGD